MLTYLKQESNRAYTENGAATYASSGSSCLDLFASIGALRSAPSQSICARFARAYGENPDLAMRILFYARDIRGGLGERRVFRICLAWLAEKAPLSLERNLMNIAEYGRWDDLLCLLETPCEKAALSLIREQLNKDLAAMEKGETVSLLGKWLPSVNASNADTVKSAKKLARFLGMKDADYRKTVVKLRNYIRILENNLRQMDYSFEYSKQPSRAMFKYRKAFLRNDGERYMNYLGLVQKGEESLHTGTLFPYDIVAPLLNSRFSHEEALVADTTWNALEDFTDGENALVVIDGSGSMYMGGVPMPAAVALSLGIYFAERNTGAFRNHFITFSESPQLVEIKGRDISAKVNYCRSYNQVANTNIQKVFELVLRTAVKNKVPQEELPSTLYIISDMEFDRCTVDAGLPHFDYAKRLFAQHGYKLPKVVFWNVQSRNTQQPVTQNEQGVALVSGCSPRIFQMLAKGILTPMEYMLDILSGERYASITA